MTDSLRLEIGLDYNKKLIDKYPDIDDTTAAKNDNMCKVMYMEFEPDDEEYKAVQLVCGH